MLQGFAPSFFLLPSTAGLLLVSLPFIPPQLLTALEATNRPLVLALPFVSDGAGGWAEYCGQSSQSGDRGRIRAFAGVLRAFRVSPALPSLWPFFGPLRESSLSSLELISMTSLVHSSHAVDSFDVPRETSDVPRETSVSVGQLPPGRGSGREAALGIYAKTCSATPSDQDQAFRSSAARRAERFELLRVVRSWMPSSRQAKCHRWRVPSVSATVRRLPAAEDAHAPGRCVWGGLQLCASVWACPVCAARIVEGRRAELRLAQQRAKELGLSIFHATLTAPHSLNDDVGPLVKRLSSAFRAFSGNRRAASFKRGIGFVGSVRALELTYGTANGWHPHFHLILFLDPSAGAWSGGPVTDVEIETEMSAIWRPACVKQGLGLPSLERGVRVDPGESAFEYISKWGLEDELTRAMHKRGRLASLTPWDMLRLGARGDHTHRARFIHYAAACKGARQLYWSNGLRDRLGMDRLLSDEQLLVDQSLASQLVAQLTDRQWDAVVRYEAQAELLTLAEHSIESFWTCVFSLESAFVSTFGW